MNRHLAKYMHDVTLAITETWCGLATSRDAKDIEDADCPECLRVAVAYGEEAAGRVRALRPNRGDCPYASHADDCGGAGGDR